MESPIVLLLLHTTSILAQGSLSDRIEIDCCAAVDYKLVAESFDAASQEYLSFRMSILTTNKTDVIVRA